MEASTIVHTGKLPQLRGRGSNGQLGREATPILREPVLRPARIAMIMALARKFERMVKRGEILNYTDLAARSGLTRARISQLMDLTLLAPGIQGEILRLNSVDGIEPTTERRLRKLVNAGCWAEQRKVWNRLKNRGIAVA